LQILYSLLKNLEFVIPNGVCEARFVRPVRFAGVRNLSFLGTLIEEGFLAALEMTVKRIFQQPFKGTRRETKDQCNHGLLLVVLWPPTLHRIANLPGTRLPILWPNPGATCYSISLL